MKALIALSSGHVTCEILDRKYGPLVRVVLFARSLYPSKVLTPRPPHTTTRRRLITNQRFQVVGANALGFTGPTLSASQAVHHFGHCTNFGVLWLRDYLDLAPRQGT